MKAYETRYAYETTEYTVKCGRCLAEIRGGIEDFKPRGRYLFSCTCPACGGHMSVRPWQMKKTIITTGFTEIEPGSRKI